MQRKERNDRFYHCFLTVAFTAYFSCVHCVHCVCCLFVRVGYFLAFVAIRCVRCIGWKPRFRQATAFVTASHRLRCGICLVHGVRPSYRPTAVNGNVNILCVHVLHKYYVLIILIIDFKLRRVWNVPFNTHSDGFFLPAQIMCHIVSYHGDSLFRLSLGRFFLFLILYGAQTCTFFFQNAWTATVMLNFALNMPLCVAFRSFLCTQCEHGLT